MRLWKCKVARWHDGKKSQVRTYVYCLVEAETSEAAMGFAKEWAQVTAPVDKRLRGVLPMEAATVILPLELK